MEPIAYGFLVLIAGAAAAGVFVGAIGGAVAWRLRMNVILGWVLSACALLLVLEASHDWDFRWLNAELTWGAPAMTVTYLIGSIVARWLESLTRLRPFLTMLGTSVVALGLGFLYLLPMRIEAQAPVLAAPPAAVVLIVVLTFGGGRVRP